MTSSDHPLWPGPCWFGSPHRCVAAGSVRHWSRIGMSSRHSRPVAEMPAQQAASYRLPSFDPSSRCWTNARSGRAQCAFFDETCDKIAWKPETPLFERQFRAGPPESRFAGVYENFDIPGAERRHEIISARACHPPKLFRWHVLCYRRHALMLKPRQPVRLSDANFAKCSQVVAPPGALLLKPIEQTHVLFSPR